jgi:hypothetical protein
MPVKHPLSDTVALRVAQVYDGRTPLGTVAETVTGFTAIATDGTIVGTFASLREASRAFDEAAERGQR